MMTWRVPVDWGGEEAGDGEGSCDIRSSMITGNDEHVGFEILRQRGSTRLIFSSSGTLH